jgi:DNA-binding NarL/FixJ family response regulator
VRIAVDLSEGLQLAVHHKVDLVLLDLMLQNSSGVHTLIKFRKACPNVPVLVVAAAEDKATIRACLDAGARGYVPKTSALVALRGAMQSVIAGGRHIPPEADMPLKPAANGN